MSRSMGATRPVALSSPSATATTTITIQNSDLSSSSSSAQIQPQQQQQQQQQPEVLFLPLNRKKKKVSWKDGTIDNEFMQKKSSKKCCIFHKQKPFDEDDSDEDDEPHHHPDEHAHDHGDGGCRHGNHDEAGPSGPKDVHSSWWWHSHRHKNEAGDGSEIRFWEVTWVGNIPFSEAYPESWVCPGALEFGSVSPNLIKGFGEKK